MERLKKAFDTGEARGNASRLATRRKLHFTDGVLCRELEAKVAQFIQEQCARLLPMTSKCIRMKAVQIVHVSLNS